MMAPASDAYSGAGGPVSGRGAHAKNSSKGIIDPVVIGWRDACEDGLRAALARSRRLGHRGNRVIKWREVARVAGRVTPAQKTSPIDCERRRRLSARAAGPAVVDAAIQQA